MNTEEEQKAILSFANSIITKLSDKLNSFPDDDLPSLTERALYDGYSNSLNIVKEELKKRTVWRSFFDEEPEIGKKIKIKYKDDDEIVEMEWRGFMYMNEYEMMFAIVGWSYA